MQKLEGRTFDVVQDNIEKLKLLFPEIMTENKIDFDKLRIALGEHVEVDNERYEFTWKGKKQAIKLAQKQTTGTLRPYKGESLNWENTQNLYIEGDNLEVLRILQNSYRNKIKMIYIDPPYNTGNDFIYNDDFQDNIKNYKKKNQENLKSNAETNGRYHTDWLNFMYPRLKISKNLLRDDGLIFISIDNNEYSNLKKICDEIYGEDNYRNTVTIKRGAKSVQGQFDTWDKLGSGYEFVLIYSKNSSYRFPKMERELNELRAGSWNNHWRGTDRPTMRYEIFGINPNSGQWRWSQERSIVAIKNYRQMLNELGYKENDDVPQEMIDQWYKNKTKNGSIKIDLLRLSKNGKPEHFIAPTNTQLLNDVWFDVPPNSSALLKKLFEVSVFDSPKPLQLIQRMMEFGTKDDIILDFFLVLQQQHML